MNIKQDIEKKVECLPQALRLVFSLREINRFNEAETASLLNISPEEVKERLILAKQQVFNLTKEDFDASELYNFNLKYCDKMVDNVMKLIE